MNAVETYHFMAWQNCARKSCKFCVRPSRHIQESNVALHSRGLPISGRCVARIWSSQSHCHPRRVGSEKNIMLLVSVFS